MISVFRYDGIDCITPSIISRELGREDPRETVFVVPEFAKAQVEREIIGRLSDDCRKRGAFIPSEDHKVSVTSSFVGGDVLSFITLSSAILDASGYDYGGAGSDVALRCAIYSVLANYSKDFKSFGKLTNRFEYINMLIDLLGDFTRYGIGVAQLEEAIANSSAYSAEYKSKLEDIKLMMESIGKINDQYGMSFLKNRIEAASGVLASVTPEKLKGRRYSGLRKLLSSRFVFIGFGSGRNLTPQEYMLVSLLSEKGADVSFYVLSNSEKSLADKNLYKVGNEFIDRMNARGAKIEDYVADERPDFTQFIKPFAYEEAYEGERTDKVRLASISGADNQLGYVFSEIIRLTRNENYRYRDIRIVCCDDDLAGRMRSDAQTFGLEIFIDRKIELWSTLIPVFAETVLELPVHNYSATDVLRAMRCGIVRVPALIVDMFDNYMKRKNVTDGKRLFRESVYTKVELDEDGKPIKKPKISLREPYENIKAGQYIEEDEFFWKYVVCKKLLPLKKAADRISEEKTLSGKALLLRELLGSYRDDIEWLSKEQERAKDRTSAAALVRGYDEVMTLLTLFSHEMNNVPITQRAFISLIRTDMKNRVEGTIPLTVDSIEITTPDRAFVTPCKVMFLIGASRENFPHKKGSEGLLSTGELRNLSKSVTDCELPDKNEARAKEEFVTCCLMLGTVTERLYMIHNADKKFTSSVFDYLAAVADPEKFVNGFITPLIGSHVEKRHDFKTSSIESGLMERLLVYTNWDGVNEDDSDADAKPVTEKGLRTSVTAIEDYNMCPLKYMLGRILQISERDDNTSVKANGFGTLIHKMYELGLSGIERADYLGKAKSLLENDELFEQEVNSVYERAVFAERIPGSISDDGDKETVSHDFDVDTGEKLRRMFTLTFRGILSDIVKAGFVPTGFEAKIGAPSKDGDDREISLCIDNSELEKELGIKIQFNGFIDRFDLKPGETGPSGLRVIDYKSGNKSISREKLFYGTQIQLPLYTKALCEGYGIGVGDSNYGYFNVGLKNGKADGSALKFEPKMATGSAKYSTEDLKLSIDYADHMVKRSIREIREGNAIGVVSPDTHSCDFCPYGGACGNVPSKPVNRIGNKKPKEAYNKELLEAAGKLKRNPYQSDGKADKDSMKEAYMMMIREALKKEKENGGEE